MGHVYYTLFSKSQFPWFLHCCSHISGLSKSLTEREGWTEGVVEDPIFVLLCFAHLAKTKTKSAKFIWSSVFMIYGQRKENSSQHGSTCVVSQKGSIGC